MYLYGDVLPFVLTQALHNTGNGQVVWCEPDVVIENSITQATPGDGAAIIYAFSGSTYINGVYTQGSTGFSYCYWLGNGATVNGNNEATNYAIYTDTKGPLSGGVAVASECEFGGFNLINIAGSAVVVECFNGHGATPTDLQANHNIRYFEIYATFSSSSNASNQGIPCGVNSCNRIRFEDCFIDCLNLPNADYSNPFIWSAQGTSHNITFSRCYFRGNGVSGQVPEVQGSSVSGGGLSSPQSSITGKIRFEDCTFDSGATSGSPLAGTGGGYLDDNNSSSEVAFVTDVEFLRCQWVHCGMSFQSEGAYFGYLRFRDCYSLPGAFSGSLSGRGPVPPGTSVTVGASPFTYQVGVTVSTVGDIDTAEIAMIVSGGTVSEIDVNTTKTGLTQGHFVLRQTDSITVHYTSAPTMTKIPH